ncbi:MAG: histone methyltransferase set2 [Peltula sp. TS41687]|nr:MAG: histone methyltransferase set2 [Peltula sp. TS41687]
MASHLFHSDSPPPDPPKDVFIKDEPSPIVSNGHHVRAEELPFQIIHGCTYIPKAIGSSDQEALGCECGEEWDGTRNSACGEDSDCINRLTKVECVDSECNCGSACQNQRFQLRQYATVSVIKTEKKGYGLQAETNLQANDFIYEYIGEVINEPVFRRRMIQYDEEGIKHFYFMSLQNGVFIDATKRGNLGRFCNHSCNPNCYVDKWVVGDKLRMGIFAKRAIKAGDELVFNYNVDRYGANPQPCYCGEPNCTGFIGGKTQTERATKLPTQTLEALGIDDGGDDWDIAIPKKARKKKTEDDEEYVDRLEAKELDEHGVTKVMPTLLQSTEKWIVVKLLNRIQRCANERVQNNVVKLHGYQIMNRNLQAWKDDVNIILQVLDVLNKFPRLTKNKIIDSKIEPTIEGLVNYEDERVQDRAKRLLEDWSNLEIAYRIPRKKRDPNATATPDRPVRLERRASGRDELKNRSRSRSPSRSRSQSRSRSRSPDPPKAPSAPTGPRNPVPQRNPVYFDPHRPPFPRRPFNALPQGWFQAANPQGKTYYFSSSGQTTWERPTMPAVQPPPPPPKSATHDQKLQEIIDTITREKPKETAVPLTTPQSSVAPPEEKSKIQPEKWRSYDEDKRKKMYENTLFPHIRHVMNKYKSKLPREDLKRFGKEVGYTVAKKLVNSDFKNQRVEDPSQISAKQEKQVKKFVTDYLDKAVVKKRLHDQKKAGRKELTANGVSASPSKTPVTPVNGAADTNSPAVKSEEDSTMMMDLSDDGEDTEMRGPEPVEETQVS